MINSIIDNDLYKFTMQQVIFHHFQNAYVEYDLVIRSKNIDLLPFKNEIEREIRNLDYLQLNPEEYMFINGIRFLAKDYINWLRNFRFDTTNHISVTEHNGNLKITIRGYWLHTILYEVPILAIISEVYHGRNANLVLGTCTDRLNAKIEMIKATPGFKFSEFGTRRRHSSFIQDHVIGMLVDQVPENLIGTSNLYYAMKYNIKPSGTMAHELLMAAQALYPLPTHHKDMLYTWAKEFQGDLGYALSDTLGSDYFLKEFSLDLAKLFDGTRHDSGDPYVYGNKILDHYNKLGVDPTAKYIVFSDALDIPKAIDLYNTFSPFIKVSAGIGTNLTNDCGAVPISIVIKMQYCNGIPVVKLSDNPEKAMGRSLNYLAFMKEHVSSKLAG